MTYRWKMAALVALAFCAAAGAARADEAQLQQQINDLRREIELQRKFVTALADLQEVKQRLAVLEQRLGALETRPPAQGRESRFPPNSGTLRLENRLGMPATIIVDGVPYRLQPQGLPGSTQNLTVPAGQFTFEALVDGFGSLQPRATRTLAPNQVYTIFTYLP